MNSSDEVSLYMTQCTVCMQSCIWPSVQCGCKLVYDQVHGVEEVSLYMTKCAVCGCKLVYDLEHAVEEKNLCLRKCTVWMQAFI